MVCVLFLHVQKKVDTATGLGLTVIFVLTIAVPTNWAINNFLLKPGTLAWITPNDANSFFATMDLTFLNKICFIATITSMVQLVEMVLDKFFSSPP